MPVIDDDIVEDLQYFQLLVRSSLDEIEAHNYDPIIVYIEDNDSECTHNNIIADCVWFIYAIATLQQR